MCGGANIIFPLQNSASSTSLFYFSNRLMGPDAIAAAALLIILINIFNTMIYQECVSIFTGLLCLRRTSTRIFKYVVPIIDSLTSFAE